MWSWPCFKRQFFPSNLFSGRSESLDWQFMNTRRLTLTSCFNTWVCKQKETQVKVQTTKWTHSHRQLVSDAEAMQTDCTSEMTQRDTTCVYIYTNAGISTICRKSRTWPWIIILWSTFLSNNNSFNITKGSKLGWLSWFNRLVIQVAKCPTCLTRVKGIIHPKMRILSITPVLPKP